MFEEEGTEDLPGQWCDSECADANLSKAKIFCLVFKNPFQPSTVISVQKKDSAKLCECFVLYTKVLSQDHMCCAQCKHPKLISNLPDLVVVNIKTLAPPLFCAFWWLSYYSAKILGKSIIT